MIEQNKKQMLAEKFPSFFGIQLKRKLLIGHYAIITSLFLLSTLSLPISYLSFLPIFYIFLGPVFFFGIHYKIIFDLSSYVENHFPELMKNNSIGYGVLKGEILNVFSINREEFKSKGDEKINNMLSIQKLVFRLLLISFLSLIVISLF